MAVFQVTNSSDAGGGSLRQAILDANGASGADTITFAGGLAGQTITLASDLPWISGDLSIHGSGVTVTGADLYRVFFVSSGAVTLEDMVIADGLAKGGDGGYGNSSGGGGAGLGGGLFVDSAGDVTLRDVTFSANRAEGGATPTTRGLGGGGGGGGMDEDGSDYSSGDNYIGGDGGGPHGGVGGSSGAPATSGGDFSGGGGGWGNSGLGTPPGHGGFGGGGGGYGRSSGGVSTAGFGGGAGGLGHHGYGGGGDGSWAGGGAGLGGAVFVRAGAALTLEDVAFGANNTVAGGQGENTGSSADEGSAEGANLFLMGGGGMTYAVTAGETRTLSGGFEADNTTIQLTKTGGGTLVLAAGDIADLGAMTAADGVLQIDRALSSAVTVQTGATLAGTGSTGAVTVQSGGMLAPGTSPGVLSTGDLTLVSGATFEVELGGTALGQYDRVNVTGAVSLGGATLDIMPYGGFTPAAGNSFVLINNDGSDAVSGVFASFADDAAVTLGGLNHTIDYQGCDGNDVVLTLSRPNTPPSGAASTVAVDYGAARTLSAADFGFSDADGDSLLAVETASLPATGVLSLNGVAVTAGQSVSAADLAAGRLVFTPDGQATVSFTFQVRDDGGTAGSGVDLDPTPNTLTISVGARPAPREIPSVGGSGPDLAILDDNGTTYAAGDGDDLAMADGGNDFVHGNAGADTIHGGAGDDIVHGGQGSDKVWGDDGVDVLFGDKGDDVVHGGRGDDVIDGGEGSDALAGGQGSDVLRGGAGADVLRGERGDDTLAGGDGADLFWFMAEGGTDVVIDFNVAEGDRVSLVAGMSYSVEQVGADTVVTLSGGGRFVLQGVQLASLGDGWLL